MQSTASKTNGRRHTVVVQRVDWVTGNFVIKVNNLSAAAAANTGPMTKNTGVPLVEQNAFRILV